MNKEVITNAASAALNASAPITGPTGFVIAGWNWLSGHDIAWFVGLSSLILIWLQIREKLVSKGKGQ